MTTGFPNSLPVAPRLCLSQFMEPMPMNPPFLGRTGPSADRQNAGRAGGEIRRRDEVPKWLSAAMLTRLATVISEITATWFSTR